MRFFVSASIQARLFRVLLLSLGGIAVALVLLWQWRIAPALRSGVEQRQKQLLQRAADDIVEFVDGRANRLVAVGEVGRFWEARRDAQKRALIRLMKLDPQIRNVSFADASGREVIQLSRDKINTGSDEVSVAQEPKFREPMKGNVFISEVGYERTAEPFMTLSVPVRFTAAEISGAMIADISLKTLWTAVANISSETAGIVSVVDENGRLIAHPDYSKVLLAANAARSPKVKGRSSSVKSDSIAGVERRSEGHTTIQNRLEIPRLRWTVVVEEPEESALGQLRAVQWAFFAILSITIAGVFVFSAYFSGRITGAVRELERGAKLLAGGNLEQRLEIRTGDEIESLGNQFNRMAEALKESREGLEDKIAERTRDLSALYGVLAPLASSGADELLQNVVERLKDATHADAALIWIFDEETKSFRYVAHIGFPSSYLEAARKLQPGSAVETAFMTGEPIVAADIVEDPRIVGKRQLDAGFRSCAFLPFRVAGELRGIVHLASREIGYFNEQKSDHLTALARQMAIALENRELFEKTKNNLRRIEALREIDRAITSTLKLRTVLDVLLEKIDLVSPYAVATIRLFNKESSLLEPLACRNMDEREWSAQPWKGGRGIHGLVFESKAPQTIHNVQMDPRLRDPEFYRRHGLISYLGIPLMVRDESLGVISFYTKEEHEFSTEEVEFLSTIAGQAAIAIQNSQLYEQARAREAQLQETNRMLSALHTVTAAASQSLDLNQVLKAAIEKITDFFHFHATRIRIYNEHMDELVLRESFDSDPDLLPVARSFSRGQGIAGKVAESGEPLIFEDVATDPLYQQLSRTKVSIQSGLHFYAVFPIRGKLRNLGTLACVDIAPRKLSPSEVQLLEAITDQIAVAMENSELYEKVRQKAQELQQRTEELERADKVKDEFLSVMSHELRTPLNVIMGYAAMIKDGMLGDTHPEQESALEKVLDQANDLLTMIISILYATSIETHEVRLEPHRFALGDFLDGLRTAHDIPRDKALTLIWNYPPDLPAVETDSEKLKYILHNLIHNAIKFTDRGQVTISAKIKGGRGQRATDSDQQPGNGKEEELIEFKVADTGIGIPEEKLPLIFEKFRQADSSETRPYGGMGLGLYVAKNFADLLGGEIEVETEEGKGSVFTVRIPCAVCPPATDDRQEKKQQVSGLQDLTTPLPLGLGLRSEEI